MRLGAALALAMTGLSAAALPPAKASQMVSRARLLLDRPYELGGRLRKGEGVDCLGVVFFAAEAIGRCRWRSFAVDPTRLVALGQLGERVVGMDPVRSDALVPAQLEPGDVLMLVSADENAAEPSIGALDGQAVWVWHTGVYSGGGKWIVGDHFAGKVIEVDLAAYLKEHADTYSGVFVTRIKRGPWCARVSRSARATKG